MKAAIYEGKQAVSIRELPTPFCGDKDVLLQNLYASVCGTDAAVYTHGPGTGHKITVGGEFGHEAVCRVAAVGKKVTDFQVGDRVYPYPLLVTGDTSRAGTIGGFSEYILAPDPRPGRQLYRVPDSIPDKVACLIEPFTVGTRAARRSLPRQGENAIVFGAGTIGIAAAIALKEFGCSQVLVADLSDLRLEKAAGFGFATCNSGKEDLKAKATEVFGAARSLSGQTADVDIYIDAAGAPNLIELYQEMGKIQSRLVVVAVLAGKRPIDVLAMTYAQHALIGSGGYMPEDVKTVMDIMAGGKYDIASIITHEFPHAKLAEAIETAAQPHKALNVVINYSLDLC
nr:zinc-binding dehydrogenase [uncultured Oscillibacter sp.]